VTLGAPQVFTTNTTIGFNVLGEKSSNDFTFSATNHSITINASGFYHFSLFGKIGNVTNVQFSSLKFLRNGIIENMAPIGSAITGTIDLCNFLNYYCFVNIGDVFSFQITSTVVPETLTSSTLLITKLPSTNTISQIYKTTEQIVNVEGPTTCLFEAVSIPSSNDAIQTLPNKIKILKGGKYSIYAAIQYDNFTITPPFNYASMAIIVYVNDEPYSNNYATTNAAPNSRPIHTTLDLKKGDEISIRIVLDTVTAIYYSNSPTIKCILTVHTV
jgi:hypothetical protein